MAYDTTNPPQLVVPSIGNKPALWMYKSTHTSTEPAATGFFTNGQALGMKVADIVLIVNSTSGLPYMTGVVTVASTATTVVGSSAG